MRDFDAIEVSSRRRLRAAGVAALAAVVIAGAGLTYLHPHLPVAKPLTKPSPASHGQTSTVIDASVDQLAFVDGALWVTYKRRGLTEIYRSLDGGLTWQHVYEGGFVIPQILDRDSAVITNQNLALRITPGSAVSLPMPVPTNLNISYAFADFSHALAMGVDGSLYEMADGAPWRPVATKGVPASGIKHDLGVTPGGRAWFLDATDAGDYFYLSEDWGRSWRALDPRRPFLPLRLNVLTTGETVYSWYPGENLIYELLPRNASWDVISNAPIARAVAARSNGDLILSSGSGAYQLLAGTGRWALLPAPPEPLTALVARDPDSFYAAGESGVLYRFMAETSEWLKLAGPFVFPLPNS